MASAIMARKVKTMTTKYVFENYENISIRRFAKAIEVNYNMLLKASKKPIESVPYDPTSINYDAIDAIIEKKEINLDEIDWEAVNEKPSRISTATLSKNIDDFNVGDKVYLREDNETPFEILYKTGTHVVIMKEGTSEPRALSHSTFFFKGPSFDKREKTNNDEEA